MGTSRKEKKEKLNTKRDALVKGFIQKVSTPTTTEKRLKGISNLLKNATTLNFNHEEAMCIWKGLFYAVWYTEMGKGCEELIDVIATGCRNCPTLFVAGFETLAAEWFGLDYIRIDKFQHFARHMLRSLFRLEVELEEKGSLTQIVIEKTIPSVGLLYHLLAIYIEELLLVNLEKIRERDNKIATILATLRPFTAILASDSDNRTTSSIVKEIYREAILEFRKRESPELLDQFLSDSSKELLLKGSNPDVPAKNRKILYDLVILMKRNLSRREATKRKSESTHNTGSSKLPRSIVPIIVN
ncbi:Ribosomal RNA processing protein 1 -like protein [Halotydeus destructor]|nr:Ribosomal RNA processing protein 1 -like protein [Halotydeus destructor]